MTNLADLSQFMQLETAEDAHCPKLAEKKGQDLAISQAVLPNGKRIRLLKTLLTSACERNCYYCPFRAGRDFRRATFKPDEFASVFMQIHRAGIAEGVFLSSGIVGGGLRTQDKLLDAADILRNKLSYQGYLHLKLMPGLERDQVVRSMQLADRVSINLEAPNAHRLEKLAPYKNFMQELLQPLKWVNEIRNSQPQRHGWKGKWPSSVTQFVVGGAGESDLELLSITEKLYRELHLSRAYYSPFRPVPDTPLDNHPAESVQREHRLYQASFLLRDYGFELEELPFQEAGNLPGEMDPKLAWAKHNLAQSPIEINKADRLELMRVPGIGPKGARAILMARRQRALRDLADLGRLGINTRRVADFILLDGTRPPWQASFWG